MTGITCGAVVLIPRNSLVVLAYLYRIIVFMAIYTAEQGIVSTQMTVGANVPLAFMFTTVYREIHPIVVESGRHPS